ncbi:hypothetical protein GQ53DRAFT_754260 [Thozetella sp. PMI_491]|nr:hypothetical protein GQ53DRAFT_754260 [Thozetella sp. PMI_491]
MALALFRDAILHGLVAELGCAMSSSWMLRPSLLGESRPRRSRGLEACDLTHAVERARNELKPGVSNGRPLTIKVGGLDY